VKNKLARGLVAVLVAVAVLLPVTLVTQPVSAVEAQAVQVLIDEVTPASAGRKSTLRVRGRVANTGAASIEAPWVQLRLSPEPLASRGEVTEVIDATTLRQGVAVPGTAIQLGNSLLPGQQSEFRITMPLSELQLPGKAAVYAFFVEALSDSLGVGRAGLLVPWFPKEAEYRASKLAFTWPLTQRPEVAAGKLVLDAALPREFASDGRLSKMLGLGAAADVAWLVDSATVETANQLADGYRVRTRSGPQPGDQSEAAEEFGMKLTETLAGEEVAVPGYAIADADALLRSGMTAFVVRSASLPRVIGETNLGQAIREEIFAAPGGTTSAETLQVLVDSGVRSVILSDAALPPDPPLNYTPTGAATIEAAGKSLNILLRDARLDEALAGSLTTSESRSSTRQEFMAELAMITLERPNEPRHVVAYPPELWDPPKEWAEDLLSSVAEVPWIDLIQLDEVNRGALVDRSPVTYGRQQRKQELPQSYVRRIAAIADRVESLSKLLNDPTGFGEGFTLALQRAASSLWRDDVAGRNRMISTIGDQVDAESRKVRVVSAGNVTLAGDSGILPLTVANDLDRSVTVGLELRTENQVRLLYDPPAPVTVAEAQKVGLEVPVKILGSQPMEVTVVITDNDGGIFDDSAKLQVQSTASNQIAALVAAVGALGFVVLVGLRLYRRRQGA
jgi:hypothetical protein